MTILWLFIWVCYGAPQVHPWNNWLVALLVCFAIDIFGLEEKF